MAIVLSGAHLRARSQFFDTFAQTLDAGLPLRTALGTIGAGGGFPGRAARALDEGVQAGGALAVAMGESPLFDKFERHAVDAGERAGKLPQALRALSRFYEIRADAVDALIRSLAYPVVLLHLAILLPNLKLLFLETGGAYLRAVVPPIAIGWALVFLASWAYDAARAKPHIRERLDATLLRVPGIGHGAYATAMADYALALHLLHSSGVPITEALERAAEVTPNAALAASARHVAILVREGKTLAEAYAAEQGAFPRLFVDSVRVAEATGKLDDALEHAARTARQQSEQAIRWTVKVIGGIVYAIAAGYVAYTVVAGYRAQWAQFDDLLK